MSFQESSVLRRNFSPRPTPEQRRQASEAYLLAACDAQVQIVVAAIKSRDPFERWARFYLDRHFDQILRGATGSFRVDDATHEWPAAIVTGRTSDLYKCGQTERAGEGAGTKLSVRAEYFEYLLHRYLAFLPENRRRRSLSQLLARFGDGEQSRVLTERLLLGMKREEDARKRWAASASRSRAKNADIWDADPDQWTSSALGKCFFGLLACPYLTAMVRYCESGTAVREALQRLATQATDAIGGMIAVNAAAQVRMVQQYLPARMAVGPLADDMLQSARVSTLEAANKFHPLHGRGGFAMYCRKAIKSGFKRARGRDRLIAMPEEKTQALQKIHRWRDHNPELAETVSLADQMRAVGIEKIAVGEMAALLESERVTDTISVQAIAEESAETESGSDTLSGILLSDRGESADRARAAAFEDPRLSVLRPSFSSLAPLHQALLAAMYCCEATEGGDLAWLRTIADRGQEVLRATVQRLSSGVASQAQIATSVSATYSA